MRDAVKAYIIFCKFSILPYTGWNLNVSLNLYLISSCWLDFTRTRCPSVQFSPVHTEPIWAKNLFDNFHLKRWSPVNNLMNFLNWKSPLNVSQRMSLWPITNAVMIINNYVLFCIVLLMLSTSNYGYQWVRLKIGCFRSQSNYNTSNVTTVIEIRSASARLFAGTWRPLRSAITTLYYVAIIFHRRRVWHRALSLRVLVQIKVRASSSSHRLPVCQI